MPVTPYELTASFSVATAMARNKVIYALAWTTLMVAADAGCGGPWEGVSEALHKGYGRVAVWVGPGGGAGTTSSPVEASAP